MQPLSLAPDRNPGQAPDGRVRSNDAQLVLYSAPVYDDGTIGDRQERAFDLIDVAPVAERIGTHILSRAASLIDAQKARLKDESRRCAAVAVTITIDRGE